MEAPPSPPRAGSEASPAHDSPSAEPPPPVHSHDSSLPPAPAMASAAVGLEQPPPKPVASIFTKEGLQKCKEQQQQPPQRPKRSTRKKEPQIPPPAPSTAAALTPPDSAQETVPDAPAPTTKAKKSRAKGGAAKAASTGKAKRKKNDPDSDGNYSPKIAPSLLPSAPRPSRTIKKQEVQIPNPTDVASDSPADGPASAMEEDNSSTAIDLNHTRRKRRKKSPEVNPELGVPQFVPSIPETQEDVDMEDIPEAEDQPSSKVDAASLLEVIGENKHIPDSVSQQPLPQPQLQDAPPQVPKQHPTALPPVAPKVVHPFFSGGVKKAETKSTHPFFAPGGTKKQVPPPIPDTAPVSSNAPVNKPKPINREFTPITTNTNTQLPLRTILSPISNRALKVPGLIDAPWPDKLQRHARGLDYPTDTSHLLQNLSINLPTQRKLKERRVEILKGEDLLENYARSLHIPECQSRISQPRYVEDEYFRVSSTLRLPSREIMTGSQLQDAIRQRTAARLPFPGKSASLRARESSPDSEDSGQEKSHKKTVHSGVLYLYELLYSMLTPFDKGRNESQLWTQKYAPQHSEDVLQVGKEPAILRDWLIKLMVETGYENPGSKKKRKTKKKDAGVPGGARAAGNKRRRKKKRAKGDGLDDFLADSDEEQDEMDEITDPEDNDSANDLIRPIPGVFGMQVKKSTIRTSDKIASVKAELGYIPGSGSYTGGGGNGKMVNAVVISGPSGCGKTAAVYAAAKELGFQVFEVNAGSRRNGKDVLDQVGEMSRTHLVHQQQQQSKPETSFFKPGGNKAKTAKVEEVIEKAQQTQSLILIEEADILYEEDKQFWFTVMGLIEQSKRPVIITCNDETLLPLSSLSLHAVLRLSPPPPDLAIDYLLLIAANEGHLLQREEVSVLYRGLGGDLRGAITQLNFWCQMGVGDRRAGLDWLLQRFPVGCDIDNKGEIKRVVSINTYIGGMGWIPQEVQDDGVSPCECRARVLSEDQIWRGVWEEWGVDLPSDEGFGGITRGMQQWSDQVANLEGADAKRHAEQAFSMYAEALSDVDIYAGKAIGIAGWEHEILDPTILPTCKQSPDELQGYIPLAKTGPWPSSQSCRNTCTDMAMTIRSLARRHLADETHSLLSKNSRDHHPINPPIPPITSEQIIATIANRHYNHLPAAATPKPIHKSHLRDAFAHLVAPSPSAPCYSFSHISSSSGQSFSSSSSSSSSAPLSSCANIAIGTSPPTLPSLFNAQYGTNIISTLVHGPLQRLTCEVAPYVRQIVRGEQAAMDVSGGAGGLLSNAKRSTRASRAAAAEASGGGVIMRPRRRGGYFPRANARLMLASGWFGGQGERGAATAT
ncbi:hypothetical protein DFH27DRAFT_493774 [Peziza echinospora]|nr:hypothetical protein DFH27DRAFT_493774 [Peziza echinospora]